MKALPFLLSSLLLAWTSIGRAETVLLAPPFVDPALKQGPRLSGAVLSEVRAALEDDGDHKVANPEVAMATLPGLEPCLHAPSAPLESSIDCLDQYRRTLGKQLIVGLQLVASTEGRLSDVHVVLLSDREAYWTTHAAVTPEVPMEAAVRRALAEAFDQRGWGAGPWVVVHSVVEGALVEACGSQQYIRRGSTRVRVRSGPCDVRITHDGYEPFTRKVRLPGPYSIVVIRAKLIPEGVPPMAEAIRRIGYGEDAAAAQPGADGDARPPRSKLVPRLLIAGGAVAAALGIAYAAVAGTTIAREGECVDSGSALPCAERRTVGSATYLQLGAAVTGLGLGATGLGMGIRRLRRRTADESALLVTVGGRF